LPNIEKLFSREAFNHLGSPKQTRAWGEKLGQKRKNLLSHRRVKGVSIVKIQHTAESRACRRTEGKRFRSAHTRHSSNILQWNMQIKQQFMVADGIE
jgi:hypothetical protein